MFRCTLVCCTLSLGLASAVWGGSSPSQSTQANGRETANIVRVRPAKTDAGAVERPQAAPRPDQRPERPEPQEIAELADPAAFEAPLARGASRQQVVEVLGQPLVTADNNTRWTYDSHIVLFRDDVVVGLMRPQTQKLTMKTSKGEIVSVDRPRDPFLASRPAAPGDGTPDTKARVATRRTAKRDNVARAGYSSPHGRTARNSAANTWPTMHRPMKLNRTITRTPLFNRSGSSSSGSSSTAYGSRSGSVRR